GVDCVGPTTSGAGGRRRDDCGRGSHILLSLSASYAPFVRVLVVEDEIRMASLLKRGLEEEGYAVDVVGDGAEAVWLATEAHHDAVVLDVMLPALDGFE